MGLEKDKQDLIIKAAEREARNYEKGNQDHNAAQNLSQLPEMPQIDKEKLARDAISVGREWDNIKGSLPETSFLEKLIKGMNYLCCFTMVLTAVVRYIEYDSEKIFMDGFYIAFTFYLIIFGVLLFAAERRYVKIL